MWQLDYYGTTSHQPNFMSAIMVLGFDLQPGGMSTWHVAWGTGSGGSAHDWAAAAGCQLLTAAVPECARGALSMTTFDRLRCGQQVLHALLHSGTVVHSGRGRSPAFLQALPYGDAERACLGDSDVAHLQALCWTRHWPCRSGCIPQ